jgi:hypothetical protein
MCWEWSLGTQNGANLIKQKKWSRSDSVVPLEAPILILGSVSYSLVQTEPSSVGEWAQLNSNLKLDISVIFTTNYSFCDKQYLY